MGIPNPTHQVLSNVFASLVQSVALFSSAAGTTGANEATGGSYARQAAGTPTPDGVGGNNFQQVNLPCAAGNYTEGGFFTTTTSASLGVPSGFAAAAPASGGSLTVGTTLYYKICAFNFFGQTTASLEISATPTTGNQKIPLSWSAVTGVNGTSLANQFAGYKIYRGPSSNGENVLLATVGATTTSFTDDGTAITSAATPPTSNTALTFVGSNAFDGGTVTVTGVGASINVAPSVSV